MELYAAINGTLGSWRYYSTKMTAKALASNVKFASEVWDSKALDTWIQRMLNDARATGSIASYLAHHEDRFFNSIVVAALEGNPTFFKVDLADDPRFEMLSDQSFLDAFGVLRFDGSQNYYALDGQHRLRAIRALINDETDYVVPADFGTEEFPVIIVVPKPDETQAEFMKKYRRLFAHLNRYAKAMDKATTIIMEEDDAIAIVTRRLIAEHPFFSQVDPQGEPSIRAKSPENLRSGEPYFTSIEALYRANTALLYAKFRKNGSDWGAIGMKAEKKLQEFIRFRPEDDVIESLYDEIVVYWDAILSEIPDLASDPRRMRTSLAEDEDNDDGMGVATNHLLFRPLGLTLLAGVVRGLLDQRLNDPQLPTADEVANAIRGLRALEWRLFEAPWKYLLYVYDPEGDKWKMRSEDRKPATDAGRNILSYVTGLDTLNEALKETLKKSWANMLLGCPDGEVDTMWASIEAQAGKFIDRQGE